MTRDSWSHNALTGVALAPVFPPKGTAPGDDKTSTLPMSVPMASELSGHNIPKRPPKMASSQSLNHLLNFTLPPRQSHSQSLPRRAKKSTSHGVWNKESTCHPYRPPPSAKLALIRVCECPISIHHESHWRLYRPFRGPGHVRSLHSRGCPFLTNIVSSNGKMYCKSSFPERQLMLRRRMARPGL